MANRTERYLYRCSSDKLMTHIGLIEESGDTIDWILDRGERGLWLICRQAHIPPPAEHPVSEADALIDEAALRAAFPSPNLGDARRSS